MSDKKKKNTVEQRRQRRHFVGSGTEEIKEVKRKFQKRQ